jgi:hypothetical protein
MRAFADIYYNGICDYAVRNGYKMSLKRANFCAPEADLFDESAITFDFDKLIDLKRTVRENSNRAEEVCERIFGSKCDSDTAEACTEQD